jgi:hypothetical protein
MTGNSDFERLLENFHPDVLELTDETIYGLWPDLTLAYFNRGWSNFASANGGEPEISTNWPIGCLAKNAIAPVLQPFFEQNFASCLEVGKPWEHYYECSSAERDRVFLMMTYPLGKAQGLLIVNSLIQDAASSRSACEPIEARYRSEQGLITQCCRCRRVLRSGNTRAWDWVPDWVKACPPETSHGLCEPCFGFYYPQLPHRTE